MMQRYPFFAAISKCCSDIHIFAVISKRRSDIQCGQDMIFPRDAPGRFWEECVNYQARLFHQPPTIRFYKKILM